MLSCYIARSFVMQAKYDIGKQQKEHTYTYTFRNFLCENPLKTREGERGEREREGGEREREQEREREDIRDIHIVDLFYKSGS